VNAFDAEARRELVLDMARDELSSHLDRYVTAHRQGLTGILERLWDKYHVTLPDIECQQGAARMELTQLMKGLGYASA
jgi:type I restriction enzyme M protein